MTRPAIGRLLLIAACTVTLGCTARSVERQTFEPARLSDVVTGRPYLKAHLRNGDVIIYSSWSMDQTQRAISGKGERLDPNRRRLSDGNQAISVDSVALFETNDVTPHGSAIALGTLTVASAALSVYCLSNWKACFGSCPTFYASDGSHDVLMAEGFSASISRALEATDIDALYRAVPGDTLFRLRMTNEALETHNVRFAHLLVARRPPGGRVLVTDDDQFWNVMDMRAAARCAAAEDDCTNAVARFDGVERFSTADSTDLATKETVELQFDSIPGGEWGLAIASRQTLLSTYLFYQTLAFMGHSAGDWLAKLERGDSRVRSHVTGVADRLGGIEVQVRGRFGWHTVGMTRETGPIATEMHFVRLPHLPPGRVTIRLRMTRGLWRLDQVQLARVVGPADVMRLDPVSVVRGAAEDTSALAALRDSTRFLTTLPGDAYTLVYRLPKDYANRELFVETRGYYLEWMREPWLAEDDQVRARRMFADPARSLRELAPAFKRAEPTMESAFWGSRYARP